MDLYLKLYIINFATKILDQYLISDIFNTEQFCLHIRFFFSQEIQRFYRFDYPAVFIFTGKTFAAILGMRLD